MNTKTWVQSTTIWGLAITLIAWILDRAGVDSALAPQIVDAMIDLAQPVGVAIAAYGRKRAQGPLGGLV